LLNSIKRTLKNYLYNIPGWRTNRKIIVIESDDWGSIRMPSRETYEHCLKQGYRVDKNAYERYDSLASEDDLELLFDLLNKYKDKEGNPVQITANALTANPDFDRIESSGYSEYHYELITDTFKKYPNHSNCFELWKKGMQAGLFFPQSHGREHLNVSKFMEALQLGDKDMHFGFKHRMPGCISTGNTQIGNGFVSPLQYSDENDKKEKLSFVLEGLDLFENLFGYRSKSFIPPNYKWSPDFDIYTSRKGVQYYQGNRKMMEPGFDSTYKIHTHYLGDENRFNQKYLVRNATFEPAMMDERGANQVNRCLNEIRAAFSLKKPAIICSHRLNYVGFIDERNRDKNLRLLEELLNKILKKWPEVEFMNSVQLGQLIS